MCFKIGTRDDIFPKEETIIKWIREWIKTSLGRVEKNILCRPFVGSHDRSYKIPSIKSKVGFSRPDNHNNPQKGTQTKMNCHNQFLHRCCIIHEEKPHLKLKDVQIISKDSTGKKYGRMDEILFWVQMWRVSVRF